MFGAWFCFVFLRQYAALALASEISLVCLQSAGITGTPRAPPSLAGSNLIMHSLHWEKHRGAEEKAQWIKTLTALQQ